MITHSPVLLVTGGSRGIGAAICRAASQAGWCVALTYRADAAAAHAVVNEIVASGGRAHAYEADVGDPQAIARLFTDVESTLGFPTGLVNNAGITCGIGPFVDVSVETLHRVMEVNVVGTMLCAQAAVRRWLQADIPGTIVNISSAASTLGSAGEYVHYATSKGAVDTFTLGLAREVAANRIRVNAVSPGTTATDIHAAGGDPDRVARVASRIPLQRAAQPEEIAEAVVWLLSDKASYVTGAVLRVGGGL
ncbi:MAG: SDR family oxidoreductase [Gammaproteobacteria bacterium]|nr:SDR family oxidoreductase [Gammaproteobacteria bacterium]